MVNTGSVSGWLAALRLALRVAVCGLPAASLAGDLDVSRYREPEDATKRYHYTSVAKGLQSWSYEGRLVEMPAPPETINGIRYQVRVQTPEGLPDTFPARSRIYYRESVEGLHSAFHDAGGQLSEYLAIPADIEPGDRWSGPSGFWDEGRLDRIAPFQTPAGDFQSCLYLDSVKRAGEPPQELSSRTVICPDIGMVDSVIELRMKDFESVTRTTLESVR